MAFEAVSHIVAEDLIAMDDKKSVQFLKDLFYLELSQNILSSDSLHIHTDTNIPDEGILLIRYE